jgi:hypothetical protein
MNNPKKIISSYSHLLSVFSFQINPVETLHGKRKTWANANQKHIVATVVTTSCLLGTTA